MKKLLKWFTLVEILIVIVIIGILIWALVPRMSAAQGRARDVARKNDLSNLQAAILVSYQDKWRYPCSKTWCKDGNISTANDAVKSDKWLNFKELLIAAWMNTVPGDPMATNEFRWIWEDTQKSDEWDYMYITTLSHWIENWWFALMAKTEVEWSSNWVVCEDAAHSKVTDGLINSSNSDVKDFHPCSSIKKAQGTEVCKNDSSVDATPWKFATTPWECIYADERELRYVMVY